MRTTVKGTSPPATVTRDFEPSRFSGAQLANIFERAVPTIRRPVGDKRSAIPAINQPRHARRALS
jgi:hypothetical protein